MILCIFWLDILIIYNDYKFLFITINYLIFLLKELLKNTTKTINLMIFNNITFILLLTIFVYLK